MIPLGKTYDEIPSELVDFIERQSVFFVASAPSGAEGHVNVSPKGLTPLRVLSPSHVAYLDLTGSGNETSAHLAQNGRVTLMLCSFEKAPLILRLYGMGRTVLEGNSEWPQLRAAFPDLPGTRQIILVNVARVQTSCGHGVPEFSPPSPRDIMIKWAAKKGPEEIRAYWREKNVASLDGLPTPLGLKLAKVEP